MSDYERLCSLLGVPLAEGKTVGLTVILVFLGLGLDSVKSQIKIPIDKLKNIKVCFNILAE